MWKPIVATLFLVLSACGDRIILLECPLGSMPQGSTCVPYQRTPDVPAPPSVEGLAEFAIAEDIFGAADTPTSQEVIDGTQDTAPPPETSVGSPCLKGSDCGEDWACLNWPDGYCSVLDCGETFCPQHSTCVVVGGGNEACLKECSNDADCPNPSSQACKTIAAPLTGEEDSVCYGIETDAGSVGAGCQEPSDCLGAAICEALTINGYCTIPSCEMAGCPDGSECARLEGKYYCLRQCEDPSDCAPSQAKAQECLTLKDADKKPVDVCAPAPGEKAIGDACVSNVECSSADCEILGEGRCSQTDTPCDVEADCQGAEFCNTGPQTKVGYCSGECELNKPCPGAGFCATTPALAVGRCRSACLGPNDLETCAENDGFGCAYGFPLGEASGHYLCHLWAEGDVGAPCATDVECPTGSCSGAPEGVCVIPCGPDFACPFPATCVSGADGSPWCRPACLSANDCMAGESCKSDVGGQKKGCAPL